MSVQRLLFMEFRHLDTHYRTRISRKNSKRNAIDEAHMQLRLRVRALRHLFGSLFKSTDLKKMETKTKPWLGRSSNIPHRPLIIVLLFPLIKVQEFTMEENLKWKNI